MKRTDSAFKTAPPPIFDDALLLNVFKPLPQVLENIIVKDKNVIDKKECKIAINKAKKIMGYKGRILVRKSGTEPKIRIMAESYEKNLIKNFG